MEVIASANSTLASHSALLARVRSEQKSHRRRLRALPVPPRDVLALPLLPSPPRSPVPSPPASPGPSHESTFARQGRVRQDLPPAKQARAKRYANYVPEEETVRNDYCARYGQGGEWPQNWVLGAEPERRFEEYPKQRRLLQLKKAAVASCAATPHVLPAAAHGALLGAKFDAIVLDPPYGPRFGWDALAALPVPQLAADPSFVFLWVGSGAGEGLERGREVLAKWGYRRCEDVVWVKTNRTTNAGPGTDPPTTSLLVRTKQHCLVGIRGTVRRSTDSWFVHCNIDTDVIFWEGSAADPALKPPELHQLVENFCLGTRRLELFGRAASVRPGWVTALAPGQDAPAALAAARVRVRAEDEGEDRTMDVAVDADGRETLVARVRKEEGAPLLAVRWDRAAWEAEVAELANGGKAVVAMSADIDMLRPKSPVRPERNGPPPGGGGPPNMGMGMQQGMGMGMMGGLPMNPHLQQGGGMPMNGGGMPMGGGGGMPVMRMGPRFNGPPQGVMGMPTMQGFDPAMGMGMGMMPGMFDPAMAGMLQMQGMMPMGMGMMGMGGMGMGGGMPGSMGSMGSMGSVGGMGGMGSIGSMGNMGSTGNMGGNTGGMNAMGNMGGMGTNMGANMGGMGGNMGGMGMNGMGMNGGQFNQYNG